MRAAKHADVDDLFYVALNFIQAFDRLVLSLAELSQLAEIGAGARVCLGIYANKLHHIERKIDLVAFSIFQATG